MKWVYRLDQDGESSRLAVEVLEASPGAWKETQMLEGMEVERNAHTLEVRDGKAYYKKTVTLSDDIAYTPGRRARVKLEDLPYTEEYVQTIFGGSGIGAFSLRDSYSDARSEEVSLVAGRFTATRYALKREYKKSDGAFAEFQRLTAWQDAQRGLLREEAVTPDGRTSVQEFVSLKAEGESGITVEGNVVRGAELRLLIPAGLKEGTPAALLKEIALLAAAYPECRAAGTLDLALAQASHLYHRYYLYPANLPVSLAGIASPAALAANLQPRDPFTFYLSVEAYTRQLETARGERSTIGIRLILGGGGNTISDANPLLIEAVLPLARGWFDGLQAQDRILRVAGKDVAGLSLTAALDLMPKNEGQEVELGLLRSGNALTVLTAAEHHISALKPGRIAYLNVRQFSDLTGFRVREDYEKVKQAAGAGIAGIVLDLRGNPGGRVSGALALVDYLIEQDTPASSRPIYRVAGRTRAFYLGDYFPESLPGLSRANLAVLMDAGSASASEITAAALRYYGTGKIIGQRSFGKGVSQVLLGLADNSGIAITREALLDPGGASFHGRGIDPDIVYSTPPASPTRDGQLDAALQWLREGKVDGAESPAPAVAKPSPDLDPWQLWAIGTR